ncbi:MAG: efflux RND transporter permease subunit [Emergencia sp.]
MSKFSVKKPFTVFVAVIIILVTGIVSYTKMTPDLFPDIDMPYVVVMTTYPGATPEKVESTVTRPLEQSLATLTDIKNVQSVSNSSYSMVILEFESSVNMDTISSDILQKVNLISGSWDDAVGTPTILKMNPTMIPVSVAAVGYEGMDRAELSAFVSDTLTSRLEGTAGVASITSAGLLEEKVNVVISQKKIDSINTKILSSVDSQLADAQRQLDEKKEEVSDGSAKISEQREKLEESRTRLEEAKKQLEAGKDYMPQEQYEAQAAELEKSETALSEGEKKLDETEKQLTSASSELKKAQAKLDVQAAQARESADIGDKITADMISGILQGQNFSMPAGYIQEDGVSYLVSVGDDIATEEQAENLFLFDSGIDGVGKVYLKDVADVFISDNSEDLYAKINGEDGIVLTFSKQSNYATAQVCDSLQEKFDELSEEYEGLTFTTLMDQGDYIHLIVSSILNSLLWGALFAVIVLFLFLRSIRPTVITICSIPISLIFAILLMYFSGITINLISMSGLAVSVGMLVDNSVVVIENTVRLRRQGVPAPKAAVAGAKQVGAAITASTLTTICVFVPIIFTDGLTRELFTDMALTMAYTLIASLIVAMTLVPAMSSKMLVNIRETESPLYVKLVKKYRTSLLFVLRHKAPVLVLALALLAGSVYFSVEKGFIFIPEMSSPQIQATLEMPKESTLAETKAQADEAMERIQTVEGVETVGAMLSSGGMGGMGGSTQSSVSFYIMLDDDMDRTSGEIASEINELCADLGEGTLTASGSSMGDYSSALGGSGVAVDVYNSDLDNLQEAAEIITAEIEKVEGIDQVESGIQESDKEYHFKVKKTAAMKKGLTVAQVYMAIVEAMTSEDTATTVTWQDNDYDVVVSSESKPELTTEDIRDLTLTIEGQDGQVQEVKLNDIADLEEKETLKSISRDNQSRYLTVSATLKEGYNVTKVASACEKALEDCQLPDGTSLDFSGENENIMDAMSDLVLMLLLGILLVYLIMVAQFQSLKSPFIIMFTIPLAFTGGLLTLLIFGKEISVIAMLGMIMLTGIIVNNGIVLVDYINQLRAGGMAKKEAICEAGMTRMRPILMTSLTTILGLIVMAFGNSAGTDMMQPIALVCIGGLLYATILTLYIVPAIYDIMNREEYRHITDADLDVSDILTE